MSMHLAKGLSTTRTSARKTKPSKATIDMWRREWKAQCRVRRKYRLCVPTFDEFVKQVYGEVDLSHSVESSGPDTVMEHSRQHREMYPSLGKEEYVPPERSVMDPRELESEPEHVRKQTLAKSQRIAPAWNKGADQYVTDGSDKGELGRKL